MENIKSEILSTTDYSIFKLIESNRPVDLNHVNKLMGKIKSRNLLHLFPILVNSNFEIIDGQHRLDVAKKLHIPVFYRVDDEVSKDDIALINTGQKSWQILDYINYWASEGKSGFGEIYNFLFDHPKFSATTALALACGNSTGGGHSEALRRGVVDISNLDRAEYIASVIDEYAKIAPFAYDARFVLAVMDIFSLDGYNHDRMASRLKYQSRSLVRCANRAQYREMLLEIYNHSTREENRLKPTQQ